MVILKKIKIKNKQLGQQVQNRVGRVTGNIQFLFVNLFCFFVCFCHQLKTH